MTLPERRPTAEHQFAGVAQVANEPLPERWVDKVKLPCLWVPTADR